MSSSTSRQLVALMAVASLAIAACTSTPAATVTPAAPSAGAGPSSASSVAPATGELPAPELTTVKMGFSNTEMSEFAPILADKLGFFKKYGLTVEINIFDGDSKVMGALQAGQIDIGYNGTSSVISSQLTDAPAVVVGVNAVVLTDDLVCTAGIDTADEVKGKKVAISSFGGTSHGAALLALKAIDLKPTDATITIVGGQTSRIAALAAGSVDCAIVDANLESEMIAQGYGIAARLKDSGIAWGRAGMDVLKSWAAKNPNTLLVALAATVEGQNAIWTQRDDAIKYYMELTEQDQAAATKQIDDFQQIGNRTLTWTDEAFNNPRKILASVNPDVIDVPVEDSFDRKPIESLISGGFYDKIGAPKP